MSEKLELEKRLINAYTEKTKDNEKMYHPSFIIASIEIASPMFRLHLFYTNKKMERAFLTICCNDEKELIENLCKWSLDLIEVQ